MRIILSICESSNSKFSKKETFNNLYKSFNNCDLYVLGDNLSGDLENYISSFKPTYYENKVRGKTKYLIDKLNFCINNFDVDDTLYLVEDDYMHVGDCTLLLNEGLNHSDYVTLYDHPDKYIKCKYPNPEITDLGEQTIVFRTDSIHWKYTNSTTGTFACKKKTLTEDYDVWLKYCLECPHGWLDYLAFKELRSSKNRKIASSIPGRSSHMCSNEMLTPFFPLSTCQ
jgi:hypothetical protein